MGYPIKSSLTQVRPPLVVSQLPEPPKTPPLPPNKTKPGGGLDPSDSSCPSTQNEPQALIPIENPVLTTSGNPTLLFYVPYGSEQVRLGEFSVLTRDEKKRLYKTKFTLPDTPGIVSISLPSSTENLLEQDQYYHWYFKLYCQGNTSSQPDLQLNGWIQRVELTPERQRQIDAGTADIWYDSLANLANLIRESPQDAQLRSKWSELLQFIEAEYLDEKPLSGAVIPLEE